MSIMYPLGFLALLGIPVLIIIYIIKNKYTEQVVSSTYLWTLSEKFLKRRNPLNKLAGIISLILQILIVLFIAVALAHPVFTVPDSAYSYCFILDGSGSMNVEQNGKTRFELAQEQIQTLIDGSASGSSYTLICVGDYTQVVYDGENKDQVSRRLDELTPSYKTVTYDEALLNAQSRFDEDRALLTYFFTDKNIEQSDNVTVVDVSSHEENYAVSDVTAKLEPSGDGTVLMVTGNVVSYESDAELTLELYVDGNTEPVRTRTVQAAKGERTSFTFTYPAADYQSVKAVIANSDALALDNESVYYKEGSANAYRALIVSNSPFYIYSALTANKNATIFVASADDYEEGKVSASGYDLYIFDGAKNVELPKDGAVWFFNPQETVKGSNFSVQTLEPSDSAVTLAPPAFYSSTAKRLLRDILNENGKWRNSVHVTEYMKCRQTGEFTTLLYCDGSPALFAGTNSEGNPEVVFAFDLHKSNFPSLLLDFSVLIRNLVSFTFPDVIDETSYVCGDTMTVNIIPGCESIRIETPLGHVAYVNEAGASSEYTLTEVGEYRVLMRAGGTERTFRVFSEFPEEERATVVSAESFSLTGEPSNEKKDGFYSEIWFWFIIIAVLAAADWMVYCYEQYQLR